MFEIMLGGRKSKGWTPSKDSMFIREVPASEFINGDALAKTIGLKAGSPYSTNTSWLLFEDSVDGKTKYVAKLPIKSTLSWLDINACGAVLGTVQINVRGKTYKVRLMQGTSSNTGEGYDHPGTHGSEWNRLMYHISAKPFRDANNTLASEGIEEGDWAQFSEAELRTSGDMSTASYCWCQESNGTVRGVKGVSYSTTAGISWKTAYFGWRPVLELVE